MQYVHDTVSFLALISLLGHFHNKQAQLKSMIWWAKLHHVARLISLHSGMNKTECNKIEAFGNRGKQSQARKEEK